MTSFLVDVSHHDRQRRGRPLDWDKAAAAGIVAATVRVSYGDPGGRVGDEWVSPYASEMLTGAVRAGLVGGGYHNLVKGDPKSIARQVDWTRREVDRGSGTYAMVDVERYPELLAQNLHPRIDDLREFCARWHAVEDRQLLVYLPPWVWDGHMGRPDLRSLGCPLVSSRYPLGDQGGPYAQLYGQAGGDRGPGWAGYGGVSVALWQFTARGAVPGLSSMTDINAYRGTTAALHALLGGDDVSFAEQLGPTSSTKARWPDAPKKSAGTWLLLAAINSYDAAKSASAVLRAVAGDDADQIVAEIRAQGEQTRAALLEQVRQMAPGLAAAVADRLGAEVTAGEIGEALAHELAGMLAEAAPDTMGVVP